MRSLRLMLSERALRLLKGEIAELLGNRPCEVVTFEQLATDKNASKEADVDLAFISRDVTGSSSKYNLTKACQDCYTLLENSPRLAWVHVHSAGADRPLFDVLRARGVSTTTSNGANAQVVAQTIVGGVLALARRFPQLLRAQDERRWAPLLGSGQPRDLDGQVVVVVGWGPIGQRVAKFLGVMGLRIVVVRNTADPVEGAVQTLTYERLPEVLSQADWLVLACPLTQKTRSLIDARALALMPVGSNLVNVSRGEVVDQRALVAALESAHLGGAFLDVFSTEPLPQDSALWGMPNVMVTPHTAGHSDGNYRRVADLFLERLSAWLRDNRNR